MNHEHPQSESGNGQVPDAETRDADLTAYALGELSADEMRSIQERLDRDPDAMKAVEGARSLARMLGDATAGTNPPPSSESLRTVVEKALDEAPPTKVILKTDRQATRWSMRRMLIAASVVTATVLIGASVYLSGQYREARVAISDSEKELRDSTELVDRAKYGLVRDEPAADELVKDSAQFAQAEALEAQRQAAHAAQQRNDEAKKSVEYARMATQDAAQTAEQARAAANAWHAQFDNLQAVDAASLAPAPADSWEAYSESGTVVRGYIPPAAARGEPTNFAVDLSEALVSDGRPSTAWREVPLGWRKVDLNWDDGWWMLDFRSRHEGETPGTEQYDAIHENPFIAVGLDTAISTFSVDVDTASYANVRRFLNENRLPPPNAVRIEELVNYFAYDYPQPQGRHPFSVNMELAQCPWNDGNMVLRIGLKGQEVHKEQRPPGNIVFLLDVSGSMKAENKLPLLRRAMKMLVGQLTENDQVTIVTYAGEAGLRLNTTSGEQHAEISAAIDSLSAGGSTNGSAGIELAYQKAIESFIEEGNNRVILATDGDLNVGISDDETLVQLIEEKAESGVFLTVLGFGTGNLKDSKLEKLADHGNGMYGYIDSLREARKVLVEQMTGSLVTIAKDVKLQLEFNPAEVHAYRLIGYENRIMPAKDFHDDTKDAGDIGAGHTVTALYEIQPADRQATGSSTELNAHQRPLKYQSSGETEPAPTTLTDAAKTGELLTLSLRYKPPEGNESTMIEVPLEAQAPSFDAASSDFRFASMVAAFGMLLRGSQQCGDISLGAVEEWASTAVGEDPQGRRTEFVDLVRKAKTLKR